MAVSGDSSSVSSLPPTRLPEYPDLYGKRRQLAKVQMLEREISSLEDELKFVQGLQPASRSCKEVADFVIANSDPLIASNQKIQRSCHFWKWLCGATCFNFSWNCCIGCIPQCERPHCCSCNILHGFCLCFSCLMPKCWYCCPCPCSRCLDSISCCSSCCFPRCPSCPDCSCRCKCSSPNNCLKANLCFCCTKNCKENCCYTCCLCY